MTLYKLAKINYHMNYYVHLFFLYQLVSINRLQYTFIYKVEEHVYPVMSLLVEKLVCVLYLNYKNVIKREVAKYFGSTQRNSDL